MNLKFLKAVSLGLDENIKVNSVEEEQNVTNKEISNIH